MKQTCAGCFTDRVKTDNRVEIHSFLTPYIEDAASLSNRDVPHVTEKSFLIIHRFRWSSSTLPAVPCSFLAQRPGCLLIVVCVLFGFWWVLLLTRRQRRRQWRLCSRGGVMCRRGPCGQAASLNGWRRVTGCRAGCIIDEAAWLIENILYSGGGEGGARGRGKWIHFVWMASSVSAVLWLLFSTCRQIFTMSPITPAEEVMAASVVQVGVHLGGGIAGKANDVLRCSVRQVVRNKLECSWVNKPVII